MNTRIASIIIQYKDRYLLAQRSSDCKYGYTWEFPGGKMDEGDNGLLFNAAVRELKEEVGLDIKSHSCETLGVAQVILSGYEFNIFHVKVNSPINETLVLCPECIGYGWFLLSEVPGVALNDPSKFALNNLLEKSK